MTDQDIIIEVAKLDEPHQKWEICHFPHNEGKVGWRYPAGDGWIYAKSYLTSRDAIILVIEKHRSIFIKTGVRYTDFLSTELYSYTASVYGDFEIMEMMCIATPKQLCIALLKATGRWKE